MSIPTFTLKLTKEEINTVYKLLLLAPETNETITAYGKVHDVVREENTKKGITMTWKMY